MRACVREWHGLGAGGRVCAWFIPSAAALPPAPLPAAQGGGDDGDEWPRHHRRIWPRGPAHRPDALRAPHTLRRPGRQRLPRAGGCCLWLGLVRCVVVLGVFGEDPWWGGGRGGAGLVALAASASHVQVGGWESRSRMQGLLTLATQDGCPGFKPGRSEPSLGCLSGGSCRRVLVLPGTPPRQKSSSRARSWSSPSILGAAC